jgi:hypothetical protein
MAAGPNGWEPWMFAIFREEVARRLAIVRLTNGTGRTGFVISRGTCRPVRSLKLIVSIPRVAPVAG